MHSTDDAQGTSADNCQEGRCSSQPKRPSPASTCCSHTPLLWIIAFGAMVRFVLLLWFASEPLQIVDETHYNSLALNIVNRGEYAYEPGVLVSIRPPLYPTFVAAVYWAFGKENFLAVRILQSVLSLVLVWVVYQMAQSLYSRRIANWAAGLCCFYPSLLGYNNLVLTEIMSALLLAISCWVLLRFLNTGSLAWIALFGHTLGLATLTRSITWLFPPLLVVFLLFAARGSLPRRFAAIGLAVGLFAATLAPWAIRNTRLQQTFTAVDVMGGRNFMMGNYEHTPLYRAWDAIAIEGDKNWYPVLVARFPEAEQMTQGQRDKAAMRYGLEFVKNHWMLTVQRCVIKFFNFWQLERDLVAGFARGNWGHVSKPTVLAIMLAIFGSYALTLISGVFGFVLVPPAERRMHWFLLLVAGFICAIHTMVFGHSRYHIPLMPLMFIYSAAALTNVRFVWNSRKTRAFWLATGITAMLVGGWIWEIVVVDLARFGSHVLPW